MSLLRWLKAAVAVLALDVALFSSDQTPFNGSALLSLIPSLPDVSLSLVTVSSHSVSLAETWPRVVLDYSYSPRLSLRLLEVAEDSKVIGMYEDCPEQEVRGLIDPETMAGELTHFLQTLNFTSAFLTVTATPFYQRLAQAFITQASIALVDVVYLKQNATLSEAGNYVGRVLKPRGSPVTLLFVDKWTGKLLSAALQSHHIVKKDYVYVYSAEAIWENKPNGALYVVNTIAINATNQLQYEALLLTDLLKTLSATVAMNYEQMQRYYASTHRSVSLMNIVAGRSVLLSKPDFALQSGQVIFPGNTTTPPTLTKPVFEVSADFTSLNFDGSTYAGARSLTIGVAVGYEEANRRPGLLPHHQFRNNSLNFGGSVFNKTWATTQIAKNRDKIGLAFHSFTYTATIQGILRLFNASKITVPVTTMSTGMQLSNPAVFPQLLRTTATSSANALVMARFVNLFGWKRVAIIYSDGLGNVDFYNQFTNITSQYGIVIANSETNRQVRTRGDGTQLNQTLWEVLNSTVRILVLCHAEKYQVLERLYDLGARAGDYMVCCCTSYSDTSTDGSKESAYKQQQVLKGGMAFFERFFAGSDGDIVKNRLSQLQGDKLNAGACLFYDHAMLTAHTVGYMLAKGLEFEDGHTLVQEMRKTRFNGCLGIIQIEPGTNDRRPGDFNVQNVHLEGENETFVLVDAAVYSPTKTQLFTLSPLLQFPDGSTSSFPDSWPEHPFCPYLIKAIFTFHRGEQLTLLLSFLFTAVIAGLAVFAARLWRTVKSSALTQPCPMSWEDSLALICLPIEAIQIAALGPTLPLNSFFKSICRLAVFQIEEFVNVSQGTFWAIEIVVLSLIALYILYCGVAALGLEQRLERWGLCGCGYWLDLILPTANNLLFQPAVLTLISTFVCKQAVGPAYTDSFLERDCYEMCWSGPHLKFAVLAAITLALYVPLQVFTRPLWQEVSSNLHVKTSPIDYLVRSVLEMVLVSAYVSLADSSPVLHAFIYTVAVGLYTLFLCLIKVTNYERMTLWKQLLSMAVLLYGIVSGIRVLTPAFSQEAAEISLLLGFVVLAGVGLALQRFMRRFRSLLVRQKEDRYDIIKFAFTFGELAQRHLQAFHSKLSHSRYITSAEPLQQ